MFSATLAMSCAEVCRAVSGASATKSATPLRRFRCRYGNANAALCAAEIPRPGRKGVPRTNSDDSLVTRRWIPLAAARRISDGARRFCGTAIPVFERTSPATRSGCATA